MTLHAWRLPLAFDPLIGEAKRRAWQRRVVITLVAVLLAGLAAGLTLALRSPGGPTGGPLTGPLATARYSQYGFSLRYPSAWTRVNWSCVSFVGPDAIAVLTNAQPAPKCPGPAVQGGVSFPPHQLLGPNVVSISLTNGTALPVKLSWNGRIDGRPANFASPAAARDGLSSLVVCGGGNASEYRDLLIDAPHALLGIHATICGPDLVAGNAAVRRILASLRFGE